MNRYIGVDPGVSGGIAVLSDKDVLVCIPCPITYWDIVNCLQLPNAVAVIERVRSSPQMGVVSAFTFGCNYGAWCMALTACKIPYEEVSPKTWQQHISLSPRQKKEPQPKWKRRLRDAAQKLFPTIDLWEGTLTNQLAVADALLIAHYCRRINRSH